MLEIKINEVQKVVDTLEEAVSFVLQTINGWYQAQDNIPLTITLTKIESRAGPLQINITEKLPTKEALG